MTKVNSMRKEIIELNPRLGVIVVAYDSGELLTRCINSLIDAAEYMKIEQHIVVVDNHPLNRDLAISNLAVDYLALPSNPGFGAANNKGFKHLRSKFEIDYFFLINPDAFVPIDFYNELLNVLKYSGISSLSPISPKICFPDSYLSGLAVESIDFSEDNFVNIFDPLEILSIFNKDGSSKVGFEEKLKSIKVNDILVINEKNLDLLKGESGWHQYYKEINFKNFKLDYFVQNAGSKVEAPFAAGDLCTYWLSSRLVSELPIIRQAWCGAAVLLPTSYMTKVGGFDENYFLYYEDTDFSMRGTTIGNFPYLATSLLVFHEHSASTNVNPTRRSNAITFSRSMFVTQNFGPFLSFAQVAVAFSRAFKLLLSRNTTIRHFRKVLIVDAKISFAGAFKGLLRRKIPVFDD